MLKALRQNLPEDSGWGRRAGARTKILPSLPTPTLDFVISCSLLVWALFFSQGNSSNLIAKHARRAIHLAPLPTETIQKGGLFSPSFISGRALPRSN